MVNPNYIDYSEFISKSGLSKNVRLSELDKVIQPFQVAEESGRNSHCETFQFDGKASCALWGLRVAES